MTDNIVTVSNIESLLAKANTPQKAMEVEAMAAAAVAWAKEQHDFESAFEYSCAYLMSRINFYEVVKLTIKRGGDGSNQYISKGDNTVTLADYGFDKKHHRRLERFPFNGLTSCPKNP